MPIDREDRSSRAGVDGAAVKGGVMKLMLYKQRNYSGLVSRLLFFGIFSIDCNDFISLSLVGVFLTARHEVAGIYFL